MSDTSPKKIELLKKWYYRKGNEPWTVDEILEIITEARQQGKDEVIEFLQPYADDCEVGKCYCMSAASVIAHIEDELIEN